MLSIRLVVHIVRGMGTKPDSPRSVQVERKLPASPNEAWILVADITRMGSWSPETTGAEWIGGANAPAVGARFKGTNQKGSKSWKTDCVVTACEPGERFGFEVRAGPFKVARWTYEFSPTETGCQVIERWDDQRNWLVMQMSPIVSGEKDRRHAQPGDDESHSGSTRRGTRTALISLGPRPLS